MRPRRNRTSERLNPAECRLPVLDVPLAVALSTSLLSAAPDAPSENVGEALD